jgi:hypothetical protein
MGWPIYGEPQNREHLNPGDAAPSSPGYPLTLEQIRQSFQTFNLLHTYHAHPTDLDNDFYLRLGLFESRSIDAALKIEFEATMRAMLSLLEPVIIDVAPSDLSLVSYEHETLPLQTTRAWPINDPKLTLDLMRTLYD